MSKIKFYKCEKCGEVLYKVVDGPCTPECCGQPMVELKANTTDAATEKHVPALSIVDDRLQVQVGSVEHPMLDEHYIQFIAVDHGDGTVVIKHFKPGDKPVKTFCKPHHDVTVYEYCNVHGLWKAEYKA